jgi:hypothetical protein
MEYKLSRSEYWILLHVVENGFSLSDLGNEDDYFFGLYAKRGHGLKLFELIEVLSELFNRKWLEAFDFDIQKKIFENKPYYLTKDEIVRYYGELIQNKALIDKDIYYRLTIEGGQAWESFASPQWNKYIVPKIYGSTKAEVYAVDKYRIINYFDILNHSGGQYDLNSIEFKEVIPWQATYWKELPSGYHVQFEYKILDYKNEMSCPEKLSVFLNKWVEWK